ncbi:PREDICTED: uncharacterized protein LOC104725692 isoform X1 [Camelina sativa]|uniref:Uncharacterized protein LOC104725692 isoform X1 n=1 Tax=Camelina sativa TaxID=90675 RepID=A0ABM1QM52_CAMSA|nr:PREDICTED: uncharacterized protein LOC104725692 isoform X1 [Camelina sativa]
MDVTNSVKNREARPPHELRRDTTVSCSPRTRFSNKENKQSTTRKPNSSSSFRQEQIIHQKPKPTTVILVSVSKATGEKQSQNRVKQRQLKPINRCKKAEIETRLTTQRPIIKPTSPTSNIRIKQRETILSEPRDVKAKPSHKKIPKSNVLENISATRPPQKQINERDRPKSNEDAYVCSSLIHKIEKTSPQVATELDSEKDYITRIMNLAGTRNVSPTTTLLDPSIFRKLEYFGDYPSGPLALQCNRRLLFDLVNEFYAERRLNNHGSELISELCSATVARYKFCQVPGEIALMDVDHLLQKKNKVEEEGEEIFAEVEREIIDALVHETASELRQIIYGPKICD